MGVASRNIRNQQIELGLRAIEPLNGKMFRIREPVDARNVDIGFCARVHGAGARFASAKRRYKNADDGIRAAGNGIAFHFGLAARRREVHHGVLRNFSFIHLEKSDGQRIRRPPVSGLNIQLLGIHPIELTFANLFRSALGDSAFFAVSEIDEPYVVIANKAHGSAVGRNLRVGNVSHAGDECPRPLRL